MSSFQEPTSYNHAKTNVSWINSMQQELDILKANKNWEVTTLPAGKKRTGLKQVYKIKWKSNETIDRLKARVVAK